MGVETSIVNHKKESEYDKDAQDQLIVINVFIKTV